MGMLRLFLALSVIVHHIPQTPFRWLHASVAVIFFFMVSGFYMTLVINDKYIKSEGPWITRFYLSRLFRIFPVYLAMIVFMVLWYTVSDTPNVFTDNMGHGFFGQLSLVLMNVFILGQDWHQLTAYSLANHDVNAYTQFMGEHFGKTYFDNSMMLVGQAWTLSIELVFYLLAPFIVHSLRRIIVLLVASLLLRVIFCALGGSFTPLAWGYFFLPSVFCFFLMGSLAYYLYRNVVRQESAKKVAVLVNLTVVTGILYIIAMDGYPVILSSTGYDTVALWLFYCVFAVCLPFVFLLWKDSRIDRWVGEFSYPVYIVHGTVIGVMLEKAGLPVGTYLTQTGIIVVSLLVAGFATYAIESPFNKWRLRRIIAPSSPELSVRSPTPLRWGGTIVIVLCLYISWLTAYSPLQAPPARLVKVEQQYRYNIVAFNDKYYGVKFGIPVQWGGRNYEDTPGLIVADTQEKVKEEIYRLEIPPARLVKVEQEHGYNIVNYNHTFYGVEFGTPIEWGGHDYENTPGLIIAKTQEAVREAIYKKAGEVPTPRP